MFVTMHFSISRGTEHNVPVNAIITLTQHLRTGVEAENLEITGHMLGLTHQNNQGRFVEMQTEPEEGLKDRYFAVLHPETHAVIAVRSLRETPSGLLLYHTYNTTRFKVQKGEETKGYGSAVTAMAIEAALKEGKGIAFEGSVDEEWAKFYKRIGFPIDPTNPKTENIRVSADQLKEMAARKGRESFRYYLPK